MCATFLKISWIHHQKRVFGWDLWIPLAMQYLHNIHRQIEAASTWGKFNWFIAIYIFGYFPHISSTEKTTEKKVISKITHQYMGNQCPSGRNSHYMSTIWVFILIRGKDEMAINNIEEFLNSCKWHESDFQTMLLRECAPKVRNTICWKGSIERANWLFGMSSFLHQEV